MYFLCYVATRLEGGVNMQSKKWTLNKEDLKAWGLNFLKFVAPTLAIFFGLMANGVAFEKAWPIALFAIYQSLSDLFGKLTSGK